MFFRVSILLLIIMTSSCASRVLVPQTGMDHSTGCSDQTRAKAKETYLYAQMSSNTYLDRKKFVLPRGYALEVQNPNDDIGFAYSIYNKRDGSEVKEVIISYRGTEGFFSKDMWYGNILACQNKSGLKLYDEVREKTDKSIPITLIGHSLGGGIALDVSLKRDNVNTFVFNTSPRFFADKDDVKENNRDSVVEYGEINKLFRLLGREATQTYTSINCISHGSPVYQHSQRQLSECLTKIAAIEDEEAKKSLVDNYLSPNIKCKY